MRQLRSRRRQTVDHEQRRSVIRIAPIHIVAYVLRSTTEPQTLAEVKDRCAVLGYQLSERNVLRRILWLLYLRLPLELHSYDDAPSTFTYIGTPLRSTT